MRDARGTTICEGQTVAFNISGDVAIGIVLSTGRGHSGPYKIGLQHNAAGKSVGHVSRVKRPRSLLVLLPGDA